MVEQYSGWFGSNPYYLVIITTHRIEIELDGTHRLVAHDENIGIDLDEPGWIAKNADKMRNPGQWVLIEKGTNRQVMAIIVADGDQPYYTARHVGVTGSAGSNEVIAYGIGKKRADGFVERVWILPNGLVCTGDDVDGLGILLVKQLGPR